MPLKVSDILERVEHRPWPLPKKPWLMTQTWQSLLFAHWPVDPSLLKALIPKGLELDLYEDQAWVGVVPFKMGFRMRYCPWALRFGELNVRTYVVYEGKPGVLFFSLDASDFFTVHAARQTYALPYHLAKIRIKTSTEAKEGIHYTCQRIGRHGEEKALFTGRYQPTSPIFHASKNTLEYWLTERYCLYSTDKTGALYRGHIHHLPWPLQQAEATIVSNTMAHASGITLPSTCPLLHYADQIEVVVWPPEKIHLSRK